MLRCMGLLLLLYGGGCGHSPAASRAVDDVRLAFLELQAGPRAVPRRLVFAAPALGGVQQPLFDLLLSRALIGACIDRTTLGHGGIGTRAWRRNISCPASLNGSVDAAAFWAPRLASADPQWEALRRAATAREISSASGAGNTSRPAKLLLLQLKGADGGEGLAGLSIVHANHTSLAEVPYAGAAALVSGHQALSDIYESVSRRRSSKPCGVHITESGELLLPRDAADPASALRPLAPALLPALDEEASLNERLVLPLSRPITLLHTFHSDGGGSSDEVPNDRDVYQYQVSTAGLPRGQKLLLGVLAHDNGQPALLLSYTTAKGSFEEAHWALPVECTTDICSYQRLVVEEALTQPLLLSLRSVSLSHATDRMHFTVHSQPLAVTRLKSGERRRVTIERPEDGEGQHVATAGMAGGDLMLPAMYFFSVRVPALHEILLHVEANQPVLLAAATDGLVALISSSPRLLAEGFPGNPAELLLRSMEKEHVVHIGVTLLSPPDGFTISTSVEEAPVPPPQDISELAMELEATGVLDGLTSSERASIIQQVHAEEVALGHLSLPHLAPLRDRTGATRELSASGFGLGLLGPGEKPSDLFGAHSLVLLAVVLLVAGTVVLATLHFLLKVDGDVARARASATRTGGGRKEGRSKGGGAAQQRTNNAAVATKACAASKGGSSAAAVTSPTPNLAAKSEVRRRRPQGEDAEGGPAAPAPAKAEVAKADKLGKGKGGGDGESAPRMMPAENGTTGAAASIPTAATSKPEKDKGKKDKVARAATPTHDPTPAPVEKQPSGAVKAAINVAGKAVAQAEASKKRGGGSAVTAPVLAGEAVSGGGRSDDPAKPAPDKPRRASAAGGAGGAPVATAGPDAPPVHRAVEQGPRVWVAPLTATALEHERELRAAFAQWGTVTSVKIKVDGNRASPGYGFIYFREEAAVRALLAHTESGGEAPHFLGRSLLVREAVFKAGSPLAAEAHGAAANGAHAPADVAVPVAPPLSPAAALLLANDTARGGGDWLQAVRKAGGAPATLAPATLAPPAAVAAHAPPTPAPLHPAWDARTLAAASVRYSAVGVATARPQLPPIQVNRLSGLQIDPFSSGADVPLPGMGASPSAGANLHSALDELGSSMLRDLLDSPPAANGYSGKGAAPQPAADSWNLGPAVGSTAGMPAARAVPRPWGPAQVVPHPPIGAFGGVGLTPRPSLRNHPASLGGFVAAAPVPAAAAGGGAAPCAPWWQSGGSGALGSLPLPSGHGLPPINGGAVPPSPPLGPVLGSSPPFGPSPQLGWGGFCPASGLSILPPMAGLPSAAQFPLQRRRDEAGGWS